MAAAALAPSNGIVPLIMSPPSFAAGRTTSSISSRRSFTAWARSSAALAAATKTIAPKQAPTMNVTLCMDFSQIGRALRRPSSNLAFRSRCPRAH
ncbi:hypothetical protein AUC69_08845 [Methyloceanibacter superfactus]|uniref:Uncharacterized protein n=1 Tax=Methyloceanibacter superfactus TaxID=1774969 RepID=A0A1E3W1U4_9HYPH|nr:hypothetical protein AUC69_08845 [Methyloceanibacter superfactus]